MKINSLILGLIVLVFIFGGIGVSAGLGYWQTESTKTPATYDSGEFAGEYNPADIRGSYSFGEISDLFDIPLDDLGRAFALESVTNLSEFLCKDIESAYSDAALEVEIGTASVRTFVALYKGLPYTLDDSTYLLDAAVNILKEKTTLSDEQIAYLDTHSVTLDKATEISPASTEPVSSETTTAEHTTTAGTITGKTTFGDLIDWGVPQTKIEELIGEKMPSASLSLRDYATQKGLEFSALKTDLQAIVDAEMK